jgi:hypothetical protein
MCFKYTRKKGNKNEKISSSNPDGDDDHYLDWLPESDRGIGGYHSKH